MKRNSWPSLTEALGENVNRNGGARVSSALINKGADTSEFLVCWRVPGLLTKHSAIIHTPDGDTEQGKQIID